MSATIRPATIHDASHIAQVHVDSWKTTYRGIVPQEYLDSLNYAARTESWKKQLAGSGAYFLIAEDAGKLCGFACGGSLRDPIGSCDAEIYAIYLQAEHQKHGIGRDLISHLAKLLLQEGFRAVVVWALEQNPACRFYEHLGGHRIAEKPIEIGGKELVEVAYGWKNIRDLIGKANQ